MKVKSLSCVLLFATPWTVACQAPLSIGFSRQQSWSWLPFPSPGDLPNPGIKPKSPALQADTLSSEPPGKALPANEGEVRDMGSIPGSGEIPMDKGMEIHSRILAGESLGQRSLMGYSPHGHRV